MERFLNDSKNHNLKGFRYLILLDLNMPIMDGWETADRLKNEPDSTTKQIPIAFLSSEDLSIEAQKAAKELGVVDYLQKGMSNEDFIARVKKILPPPPATPTLVTN